MTWEPELQEKQRLQDMAVQMGGPDKVKRHHDGGRLTVRERIDAVLDPGSFHEIGALAGKPEYGPDGKLAAIMPANFVFGRGRIDGRPVVVGGDDFTIRGGSADASIKGKQLMSEQMALELRIPVVRLVDGSGGGGSVKKIEQVGYSPNPTMSGWDVSVANLGMVPVVSLGLGSIAGLGAARMAASHYSLMVRGTSQMFIAGPPLVAKLGQTLTREELGGADIHLKAGAIDDVVDSEQEAFARARQFLSYLPSSVYGLPPRAAPTDDPNRREDWLIGAIPRNKRQVYDMRAILKAVVDTDSFFEIGSAKFGGSLITGLARLDGWPVAIMAGNPRVYAGGWTADASRKAERFVDLANTFHLPVVYLVDCPGFVIGLDSEKAGTIRHGVRAMSAIYQAATPWCTVLVRRAFGVAGAAQSNHSRLQYRYAWPSGEWGSVPTEGGIEAAYRAELESAPDPVERRAEIQARLDNLSSPYRAAHAFDVEEIIDPRDTRPLLCEFANLTADLRQPGPVLHAMRP